MSSISLTASVRSGLASLKVSSSLLEKTTHNLSTGKKVASAIDNPTNYFAAENYNDRANALSARLDSMSEATQMINAADNGITNIRAFLSQMKGVVNDALSNTDSDERRDLGKQFNELIVQVKAMAKDSSYGGINLLYGNAANTVEFGEQIGASTLKLQGFNISGATDGLDDDGEMASSGVTGAGGDTFALSIDIDGEDVVGIKSFGVLGTASTTVGQPSEIITALNSMISAASTLEASYPSYPAGDISILQGAFDTIFALANSIDSDGNYLFDPTGSSEPFSRDYVGMYIVTTYNGSWNSSIGNAVADLATSVWRLSGDQFYGNPTVDDLPGLEASMTAASDELTAYASSLGAGGTDTHEIDWGANSYQEDLSDVIEQIEDVDGSLKTQAGKLANNLAIITQREDFTNSQINNLTTGADNLTLADLNKEGANMLALQTSSSLATQALSLASEQSANVLAILR